MTQAVCKGDFAGSVGINDDIDVEASDVVIII